VPPEAFEQEQILERIATMKTLIIILCFLCSACAGWQINGTPVDRFKEMTTKDFCVMAAGVAASYGVHYAGHVAYLESNSIEWNQDGLSEMFDGDTSDGQASAIGRAGFVSQLAVGLLLNVIARDSAFVDGYDIGSFSEVALYPLRCNGDIELINRAGNARAEWTGYTALSTGLLVW